MDRSSLYPGRSPPLPLVAAVEPAEPRKKKLYIEDIDKVRIEYDKQSDTLYIHFADPDEEAEEAFMTEEDIIVRVKDGKLLTITVMGFSEKTGYQC